MQTDGNQSFPKSKGGHWRGQTGVQADDTDTMIKSSPASIIITAVIAALGVGVGLIIGYLLRTPVEDESRQGLRGHLTPLRLIKAGGGGGGGSDNSNSSVSAMFEQCRKTASDDPAITE